MVIDTSAVIACLFGETERASFISAIVTFVGVVEASLVILGRKRMGGLADLQVFLNGGQIERVPIDDRQAEPAIEAFRRFGRGVNIGDCFAVCEEFHAEG